MPESHQEWGKRLAEHLGVRIEDTPCVWLILPKEGDILKYIMQKPITHPTIMSFLEDYRRGALQQTYRSESEPKDWDTQPVKVAVGNSFKRVVIDSPRNVLVYFYLPTCPHCRDMTGEFIKAAEGMQHDNNYHFVKINMNDNELREVDVKSYPTLMLFKKNNKHKPITFSGKRTAEDFQTFLTEIAQAQTDS